MWSLSKCGSDLVRCGEWAGLRALAAARRVRHRVMVEATPPTDWPLEMQRCLWPRDWPG